MYIWNVIARDVLLLHTFLVRILIQAHSLESFHSIAKLIKRCER